MSAKTKKVAARTGDVKVNTVAEVKQIVRRGLHGSSLQKTTVNSKGHLLLKVEDSIGSVVCWPEDYDRAERAVKAGR